ncbi:sensor histidine kinase [Ottowia thiooxydans]|uniref:sensor histidine kinase n=1 Tax=Ottowia thiooxydans TaxID=219182 RepID=UPI000401A52A|nr:ATP-binding protein [Ottowia thiooxydans]
MMASLVMIVVALCLALYAVYAFWRRGCLLDLLYAAAMLPWTLVVTVTLLTERGWFVHDGPCVVRIAYQIAILGITAFLLQGMDALHWPQTALLAVQALLGAWFAALPMTPLAWSSDIGEFGWSYANAVFAIVLSVRVIQLAWRSTRPEGWMVLLVLTGGLGVMAEDVSSHAMGDALRSVSHYFFAAALLVLWLILSRRIETSTWKSVHSAEESERGQLAQDLHDGVGSHLASIIAALATGSPQQRATAVSLQHCLLELKVLVDGQSHDGSVIEHLASLRYRLQPLLKAAGLQMSWHISDEEVLECLRGDAARQVLRVAQEALANVVRHAGADEVVVACGYAKTTRALVLEIVDNGVGLPPGLRADTLQARPTDSSSGGRGLLGMARRAKKLGGHILIEPAQGRGTRVQLLLPLWRHLARPSRRSSKSGWANQLL